MVHDGFEPLEDLSDRSVRPVDLNSVSGSLGQIGQMNLEELAEYTGRDQGEKIYEQMLESAKNDDEPTMKINCSDCQSVRGMVTRVGHELRRMQPGLRHEFIVSPTTFHRVEKVVMDSRVGLESRTENNGPNSVLEVDQFTFLTMTGIPDNSGLIMDTDSSLWENLSGDPISAVIPSMMFAPSYEFVVTCGNQPEVEVTVNE